MSDYFYVWRSGLAEFGDHVPEGALPAGKRPANLDAEEWKSRVSVQCRLAYPGALLVPGVPEAETVWQASRALRCFSRRLSRAGLSETLED